MADLQPNKPSWLSIINAIGTLAVVILGAWSSGGETPPQTAPQPIDVVTPVDPTPVPEPVSVPTVNYVVGPDGAVLEGGSVPHFSAVSKQPHGAYEFHRIQAKKPVSVTRVAVGDDTPTPPKPDPPAPPAPVVDDFSKAVKTAYASDADGNKLEKLNQLIAGYAACQTSINNTAFQTTGELYADIRKAVFSRAGSVSLQNTREAVGKELNSKLSDGGTLAMNADVRAKISEQFKRVQTALEGCR